MIEDKKNKGVVSLLFEFLEKKKIPYAVLRNYQTLPEKSLPGSDIDILIDEKRKKDYELILAKAVKNTQNKTFILSKTHRFNCLSYFIYQKTPFCFSSWIDAFTKIASKSFVWLDRELLLENRIWHKKGFYILSPGDEAATLFLKEILAGFPVKEMYRSRIQDLIKEDETTFIQVLSTHFGKKNAKEMKNLALKGKWNEAFKKRKKWWKILICNTFYHRPIKQLFYFLSFFWGYFREYFCFRKGIFIAVIGPDGGGKTTICRGIGKRIEYFFLKKVHYYHGRFGFFPELSKLYNFLMPSSSKKSISSDENFSKARAFLHLIYYGLETFLFWPWVFWGKIRGKVFIFDRYFYDYTATRTHRQLPHYLFLTIAKFIPHPDLTFIVNARPGEIHKRKKELPVDEIKSQLRVFQSPWLSKLTSCSLVNTEESREMNLDKIENKILEFLSI